MILLRHAGGTFSAAGVPSCGIIAMISPPSTFAENLNAASHWPGKNS